MMDLGKWYKGVWIPLKPITFTNGGNAVTFVADDDIDEETMRSLAEADEDFRLGRTIRDDDLRRKED